MSLSAMSLRCCCPRSAAIRRHILRIRLSIVAVGSGGVCGSVPVRPCGSGLVVSFSVVEFSLYKCTCMSFAASFDMSSGVIPIMRPVTTVCTPPAVSDSFGESFPLRHSPFGMSPSSVICVAGFCSGMNIPNHRLVSSFRYTRPSEYVYRSMSFSHSPAFMASWGRFLEVPYKGDAGVGHEHLVRKLYRRGA